MSFNLPITIEPLLGLEAMLARRGHCPNCWQQTLKFEYGGNGYEWLQCSRCFTVFVIAVETLQTLLLSMTPSKLAGARACPRCGRLTRNPTDIAQGYCGACHAWT